MKYTMYVCILTMLVSITTTFPRAGNLDPTFGNGTGKTTTDFGMGVNMAQAVVIQKDGKIISVGGTDTAAGTFALVRYNPDGTQDSTFGTNGDGQITTDFPGTDDSRGFAAALQEDGKIVVAGATDITMGGGGSGDFALARYNTDGLLDTTFNTGGTATLSFTAGADQARGVAIQPDGKIVVVGTANFDNNPSTGQIALARYNKDGSLDTSFNANGPIPGTVIQPSISGSNADRGFAIALQSDGNIVIVGTTNFDLNNSGDFVILRYKNNGTLDTSFGTNGITVTNISNSGSDIGYAVFLQQDGKIIAAGRAFITDENYNFALVRYNKGGSLDTTTFNPTGDGGSAPGIVITDFGSGFDEARGVVVQKDGKIIAAGLVGNFFGLARYHTNGSLDTTFGEDGNGKVTTAFIQNTGAFSFDVALQADGKIVLVGVAGSSYFGIARYLGDTLIITKEASSQQPCPGQNIIYTITAINIGAGGGTVNSIEIEDVLPDELTFRSVQTSGEESSFDPATRIWSIPCLGINQEATLKLKARVGQCAGNQIICNTAVTSYSSVDNVTDSSLFEELGISTTEIFSTTECVSTLPVVHENLNIIANRTDCGVDDANEVLCDLTEKVCEIKEQQGKNFQTLNQVLLKLDCLSNFFSATDCLF